MLTAGRAPGRRPGAGVGVKRRWKWDEPGGAEDVHRMGAAGAPRCRLTRLLREQAAAGVAARDHVGRGGPARGVSRPVAHEAFAWRRARLLRRAPVPVAHLGIDEHRRVRPRWRIDERTGDTCCSPGRPTCGGV